DTSITDIYTLSLHDALPIFHKSHQKLITMTAVQPEGRFGAMKIENDLLVSSFEEKPEGEGGWINGGFFVCQPEVLDYIAGDHIIDRKSTRLNSSHVKISYAV